jgi:hypothetical protein
MAESDGDQLKVKGPFGIDLSAKGPSLIIILTVAAVIGVAMWEHYKRAVEAQRVIDSVNHQTEVLVSTIQAENKWVRQVVEKVGCHVQFNTWIGRIPREAPIDWHSLPENLYDCIPESLTGRRK